jgi:DNA-binding NarL/FixJ family response regulator
MGDGEFADQPPHSARPQPATRELSVVVASDDPFTRHAFRTGATGPGITVLGAGTLASVSEEMAGELEPDVVVLDVQTTAADALAAIQQIRARAPRARILACSAPAGNEFGLLCLTAGAWGYVSKDRSRALTAPIARAGAGRGRDSARARNRTGAPSGALDAHHSADARASHVA